MSLFLFCSFMALLLIWLCTININKRQADTKPFQNASRFIWLFSSSNAVLCPKIRILNHLFGQKTQTSIIFSLLCNFSLNSNVQIQSIFDFLYCTNDARKEERKFQCTANVKFNYLLYFIWIFHYSAGEIIQYSWEIFHKISHIIGFGIKRKITAAEIYQNKFEKIHSEMVCFTSTLIYCSSMWN